MFTGVHTVIFYVQDINKAKDFYIKKLGFILDRDDGDYVSLKISPNDDTNLALNSQGKRGQYPGHQTVILKTDNIENTWEILKDKQLLIELPLTTQPWGKTFIFKDPDGNKIEVLE